MPQPQGRHDAFWSTKGSVTGRVDDIRQAVNLVASFSALLTVGSLVTGAKGNKGTSILMLQQHV